MALHWDETLLLGNSDIDGQHREIFVHFEQLSQACQSGQGEAALKGLLKYLGDYVDLHFSQEEALMALHSYPGLLQQQEQHASFRQKVMELQERDLANSDAHQLSIIINRRLILWFIQHIRHLDQAMVTYIRAK
jgi:hemerythrin